MEQFGALKYAVLCKATGELGKEGTVATHRGTGFVRFKSAEDANALLELSSNLE